MRRKRRTEGEKRVENEEVLAEESGKIDNGHSGWEKKDEEEEENRKKGSRTRKCWRRRRRETRRRTRRT